MNRIFDELKRWEKRERWGEKNNTVSNDFEIRDEFNGKCVNEFVITHIGI